MKLKTPKAGGPYTLVFKGNNTVQLKNVLSGDVWLCSGQSNMQVKVGSSASPGKDIAGAQYPHIRHFWVGRNATQEEAANCKGEWTVCSPQTVKVFSAVAYFTGRELHKNLDVPIGLLTTCWGGTCVETWTPWAEQAGDTFALARKAGLDEKAKGYSPEKAQAEFELKLKKWKKRSASAKARNSRPIRV